MSVVAGRDLNQRCLPTALLGAGDRKSRSSPPSGETFLFILGATQKPAFSLDL